MGSLDSFPLINYIIPFLVFLYMSIMSILFGIAFLVRFWTPCFAFYNFGFNLLVCVETFFPSDDQEDFVFSFNFLKKFIKI